MLEAFASEQNRDKNEVKSSFGAFVKTSICLRIFYVFAWISTFKDVVVVVVVVVVVLK